MNIREYSKAALRTIKEHESKELAYADWSLGLGGEAAEVVELIIESSATHKLNKMEMAKEIGDVLWYCVALVAELGKELSENCFDNAHSITLGKSPGGAQRVLYMTKDIGTVQEAMKHSIMHKEGINAQQIAQLVENVVISTAGVANYFDIHISDCAKLNVAKLNHRYGGGEYSHEASAQRRKAEQKFEDTKEYQSVKDSILAYSEEEK